MHKEKPIPQEETLDPDDWEPMRSLGHRMIDDMVEYLKTIRDRPVWRHAPESMKEHFKKPLPRDPEEPWRIYEEFMEYVLPYPIGCIHPRFWGWAFGTGTVMGAYAELLAAFMNTNSGDLAHHSAIHVEKQVIRWFKEIFEFPPSASGLLTTGTSAANLIGLTVARNAKAGFDVRREGMHSARQEMVLYISEETHSSIQKAAEILGLGSEAIRHIPVNDSFQIDIEKLGAVIASDREQGALPFCVVGTVGTVNTGAIDDCNALADLCERERLWLHIDGAFGAWAILAPKAKEKISGIERADSLAFDLHKWMYMPYEIGCVLVRNEKEHRKAFSLIPAYLSREEEGRGLAGGDQPWFIDYGFELSRGFRALKAWMSLKEHGTLTYGRLIQQNIDHANYLAQLIESSSELELMAPVTLNVVCFRYTYPDLNDESLDALNREIIIELQEKGIAVLSGTTIMGRYVLRVGHTNHRSRREDFDILVREIVRIGRELTDLTRIPGR